MILLLTARCRPFALAIEAMEDEEAEDDGETYTHAEVDSLVHEPDDEVYELTDRKFGF